MSPDAQDKWRSGVACWAENRVEGKQGLQVEPGTSARLRVSLDGLHRAQAKAAPKTKHEEADSEEKRRLSLTKQPRASVNNNTFALHVAPVRVWHRRLLHCCSWVLHMLEADDPVMLPVHGR